ncbi:MAG: hypothetical protein ACPGN3_08955 [Opitutales bacterium]
MFSRLIGLTVFLAVIGARGYVIYVYGLPVLKSFQDAQLSEPAPGASASMSQDKYGNPAHWAGPSTFPLTRTLTDVEGRSVQFIIHGRAEDRIYVKRSDSDMEHVIYFDTLSTSDRTFVEQLPNMSPSEVAFAKNKKEEAEKIIADLRDLHYEASSGVKTGAQIRNIDREIEFLERKLLEVRSQLMAVQK